MDNPASSQKPQVMIDRFWDFYKNEYAKTDEIHSLSKKTAENFEQEREKIAKLINSPNSSIFEHAVTEAISRLAKSFARGFLKGDDEILVSSVFETSSDRFLAII